MLLRVPAPRPQVQTPLQQKEALKLRQALAFIFGPKNKKNG